ncbi:MAG: Suppressor of Sensor Kinase (SLN1) [Chaenotheca gracillima]|nr:MAG: Suppressor of Sensor Kinase (SLN1) [Chaenotheca gracillima]
MSVESHARSVRFNHDKSLLKDGSRVEVAKLPHVMERAEVSNDSEGSGSSDDSPTPPMPHHESFDEEIDGSVKFTPNNSVDSRTPTASLSNYSWTSSNGGQPRPRGGSVSGTNGVHDITITTDGSVNSSLPNRAQRPTVAARTPSSTYNPARHPGQFISFSENRNRSMSATRSRRDPGAQYRAQEKAYVQRLRQEPSEYYNNNEAYTPSLGYSTESETDDESPSSEAQFDNDPYDQDVFNLHYENEIYPSSEQLNNPNNRERLEWHSMLASVLTGDVVKQEKKRLIGGPEQQGENSRKVEIWTGVRAKLTGRTIAAQKRLVEDGRAELDPVIESIIRFEIKGNTEVGKTARQQVQGVVKSIERCESLYPTRLALETAKPRAASEDYRTICDAVISWNNTTEMINTELAILQSWVGNDELDFRRVKTTDPSSGGLTDEASFLDRILKEDGLKSLQGDHSMLIGVGEVIKKAKHTLIENAKMFQERHLPPYFEELFTLLNFPSRLIGEVIRMRLSYASRMKDPAQQSTMIIEQMISQFQILLKLAVQIKQEYNVISQPEEGWNLPDCVEETFDIVVVDALKFYFKMLNWKLTGNKNTFKEAEILEQEWEFSNEIGRFLDGGDVEVAEQFSSLTSKALSRLATHFEKELQRQPGEAPVEMDRRYKQSLDQVRVRQRKLFRFSRLLGQRFENSTEYNITIGQDSLQNLYDALIQSGHFRVKVHDPSDKANKAQEKADIDPSEVILVASPSLSDHPKDVESILGTCFHAEDTVEDPSNPYVLMIRPETRSEMHLPLWVGHEVELTMRRPPLDIKPGRLRLIADGSQARLANARLAFSQLTVMSLDVIVEQRANLPRVNTELMRIKKTAYKLSNTIMDSVEIIRKQTIGLECQELIQTCFAFATEFGQRSLMFMDNNRRALNNLKLTRLALDWISFICDDCVAADRKTFRWAVVALEFAMVMTTGRNILSISDEEYARLRAKVAGCMSLLISHFDIMGARSTLAAQVEKQRIDAMAGQFKKLDTSRMRDDDESSKYVREGWLSQLAEIDDIRKQKEAERQALGRVLEDANEADRSLTFLSSSATNVTLRWQQGVFVGGGTFGSVYAAINLDSGHLMAVKEIRLQDPQLIPTIAQQIRDEMGVLEVLDHPNIVSYYGIEVHRDKVYIFMEYCSGGSLAGLLEHGRIEDETVIMVYALQMLEGLAYLHESGIVHRDIKPENILLDHNGVIKYVDFGAAKIITRQGKTMAGDKRAAASRGDKLKSMTGTPMYMSPEVIKGATDGRHGAVDVWSLGCVILEMATGRRPWASLDNEWAIMYNIAQGNPPQMPAKGELSPEGVDFLRKCFERDPIRRSSAPELLQHEWIMKIRDQVNMDPGTPASESSSSNNSYTSGSVS